MKQVSGGHAMFECALIKRRNREVPDLGQPNMKIEGFSLMLSSRSTRIGVFDFQYRRKHIVRLSTAVIFIQVDID